MVHEIAHSLPLFMQQVELKISSGDNWKYYGAEALMDVYSISGVKQDQASIGQVIVKQRRKWSIGFYKPNTFRMGCKFFLV